MLRRPPRSTLFPYPTLFRSCQRTAGRTRHPLARIIGSSRLVRHRPPGDRKSTRLNSSHGYNSYSVFFFNATATTEIYPLSLPDALPILSANRRSYAPPLGTDYRKFEAGAAPTTRRSEEHTSELQSRLQLVFRFFF